MTQAAEILKTPTAEAARIFPGDEGAVKQKFHALVNEWHPDRNKSPDAQEVLRKLVELKNAALRSSGAGSGALGKEIILKSDDGKTFRLKYLKEHGTDAGSTLIGTGSISFLYDNAYADIGRAEKMAIDALGFANDAMKKQMSILLPQLVRSVQLDGGRHLTVMKRPGGTVLLKDLIDAFSGKIPTRHVAWIVSGMMNVACYMEWAGTVHGALSPETILISPERHSVHLVGGWGFSTKAGSRPTALPRRTTEAYPKIAVKGQVASSTIDLALIRNIALECLGKTHGGELLTDGTTPKSLANWISLPPARTAAADYEAWHAALIEAFGPRRFEKMSCTAAVIYGA